VEQGEKCGFVDALAECLEEQVVNQYARLRLKGHSCDSQQKVVNTGKMKTQTVEYRRRIFRRLERRQHL